MHGFMLQRAVEANERRTDGENQPARERVPIPGKQEKAGVDAKSEKKRG